MHGLSPACPSDLADARWALIEPLMPVLSTRGRGTSGGRPAKYSRRRIVDATVYLGRTGCSGRQPPHDFPPWEKVHHCFQWWAADGTTDRIHDALRGRAARVLAHGGRARHRLGIHRVGRGHRTAAGSCDVGKKVNGRERPLVVDTVGLLVVGLVTVASVQDRDGGIRALDGAETAMPPLVLICADAAHGRRVPDFTTRVLRILVPLVAKLVGQHGFVPLPRRWVVERTHAGSPAPAG